MCVGGGGGGGVRKIDTMYNDVKDYSYVHDKYLPQVQLSGSSKIYNPCVKHNMKSDKLMN